MRSFIRRTAIAAACCWTALAATLGVSSIVQANSNRSEKQHHNEALNRNAFFRQAAGREDVDVSTGYGKVLRDVLPLLSRESAEVPPGLQKLEFPGSKYEGVGEELNMDITDDVSPFNQDKRFNRNFLQQTVDAYAGKRQPLEEPVEKPDLGLHLAPWDTAMPNFLLIFFGSTTGLSSVAAYALATGERRQRRTERRRLKANPVARQLEEAHRDAADLKAMLEQLGDVRDREVEMARRQLRKELLHTQQVIMELSNLPTTLTAEQARLVAAQINRRNLERLDLPKTIIEARREVGELGPG
jgi:hypothetical protein